MKTSYPILLITPELFSIKNLNWNEKIILALIDREVESVGYCLMDYEKICNMSNIKIKLLKEIIISLTNKLYIFPETVENVKIYFTTWRIIE